ncbi:MAG TPA: fibronectin type III domain-containing protein [Thermoanaerobaculia bacterium]|nr:fibronectin type III domain-containing protein [Thermoanaerobaculia bacterium]
MNAPGERRGRARRHTCRPAGRPRRPLAALGLLALALAATACGKQGDPLPPYRVIPVRTEQLVVYQQGDALVLRMPFPRTTTAGEPLPRLGAVELWQTTAPVSDPQDLPAVEPRQFERLAERQLTLAGAELTSAVRGDELVARLRPPEVDADAPQMIVFAVRTVPEGGEPSAYSNLVRLVLRPPPPPPTDLRLAPGAEGIEVSWQWHGAEGQDQAGFHLYRRRATERSYGDPLKFMGPFQRSWQDDTASFGERYIYTVTALASRQPRVESGFAEEREIHYEDRFPPPPPPGLVALSEPGSARLVWRPSAAADVTGYHLYRQDPQADFRRLTERPLAELKYTDTGLTPGLLYRYRLTAVDAAGNEGPASEPVEVRPR